MRKNTAARPTEGTPATGNIRTVNSELPSPNSELLTPNCQLRTAISELPTGIKKTRRPLPTHGLNQLNAGLERCFPGFHLGNGVSYFPDLQIGTAHFHLTIDEGECSLRFLLQTKHEFFVLGLA